MPCESSKNFLNLTGHSAKRLIMLLLVWALLFRGAGETIAADETVVFFPTAAHFDAEAGVWRVPIHGWIYQLEADSVKRSIALGLLRRAWGLDKDSDETELFRERARLFLVDNKRGKQITIRIGEKTFTLPESGANGHFAGNLELNPADISKTNDRIEFQAVLSEGDERTFAGAVQLVSDTGLSVISDIDDTIKISNVAEKRALIHNTFCREFEAVPGMSDVYRRWAEAGAAFHYVSASPWQLYGPLSQFTTKVGFPVGTFQMKQIRVKDSSILDLVSSPDELKRQAIEPILAAFPQRTFICVGDSGERDPEIFAAIALKHPQQIMRIYIRDVTGETADSPRMQAAFAGVPAERWHVFRNAAEIPAEMPGR